MGEQAGRARGIQQLWTSLGEQQARCLYERGSYLYTPAQPAQHLFMLVSGLVRLQITSPEGRALTIGLIEPQQICGHAVLTGAVYYDTFAEAIGHVQAYRFRRQDILQAMREQPGLTFTLIDELGQHCLSISQRLDEVAFKSVPARLASLLINLAPNVQPPIEVKLPRRTHQQLADMINAQRETVTKTINEFRAARLVAIDRTAITLLNLDGLRELAAR